jgi:hypothetical protein
MKITEVIKSDMTILRESLEASNLTEQATSTLMTIAEQATTGTWSESMTAEQMIAENNRLMESLGVKA